MLQNIVNRDKNVLFENVDVLSMISFYVFRVPYSQASFNRRGFYISSERTINHLEYIGCSFLNGFNSSLKYRDETLLCKKLNMESNLYNGFGFEGAAMSKAIFDTINFFRRSRLNKFITHPIGGKHVYMLHVGAGWAYSKLSIKVERKIKFYDEILRWLIIDGYGFHKAYFKTNKYVFKMREPKQLKNPYSKHVFYQGVGRCLWFVEGADANRITKRIQRFANCYHGDLWAGIGLACAYAGGVDESVIIKIKALSEKHYPSLMQGVVFAAKARQCANNMVEHTELASRLICNISAQESAILADYCFERIPITLSSEQKYTFWKDLIIQELLNKKNNEKASC